MASLVIIQNSGPAGQLRAIRETLQKHGGVMPEEIEATIDKITHINEVGDTKDHVAACAGALCDAVVSEIFARIDSDRTAEALFTVIISLLTFAAPEKMDLFAAKIADVAAEPLRARLRLLVLGNIFNAVDPAAPEKLDFFSRILEFCAGAGIADLVLPETARLREYLESFHATVAQRRQLYALGCKIIRLSSSVNDQLLLSILPEYLATFEDADVALSEEALDAAQTAVLLAVGIPNVFRMDHLLNIRAVKGLAEIPAKKPVFDLLEVFCRGCCKEYSAFLAANPGFLEAHALDGAALADKMKILSLVTVCSETEGDVPLAKIAEALEISVEDVDTWFVEAISHGLISGKIDATQQVARAMYCEPRVFGQEQWAALAARLRSWERSTVNMQQYLQQADKRAANRPKYPRGRKPKTNE